ncbi:MAG: hypothetical protein ABIH37_02985 [archaeon]
MKKGQTTVFIIIAIVIFAAVAGTSYIIVQNKKTDVAKEFFSSSEIKSSLNSVQINIQNCLESASKESLQTIGIQGGLYERPLNSKDYFDLGWTFIPYYYNQGRYLMPSKQEVEIELSKFNEKEITNCIKSVSSEGFELEYTKARSKTTIEDEQVLFEIDLPIKIKKDKHSIVYETADYPVIIPSELSAILNIADYITETHKQDPSMYCITCVSEMAEENELYVDIINFQENEMLIVISENHISSEPYSFEFLNRYTGNEVTPLSETQGNTPTPPPLV